MTIHAHKGSLPFVEAGSELDREFRRLKQEQGDEGPLAVGDLVVHRTRFGEFHLGPLEAVSLDARTALVRGYLNGNTQPVELRVERRELVRFVDIRDVLDRVFNATAPCQHCTVADVERVEGRPDN